MKLKGMLKYQIVIGLLCFALGVIAVLAIQNYRKAKYHNINPESELFNREGSIDNSTLDYFFDDAFFGPVSLLSRKWRRCVSA